MSERNEMALTKEGSADHREEKLLATIVLFEPRWQFCITFADKSDEKREIAFIILGPESSSG